MHNPAQTAASARSIAVKLQKAVTGLAQAGEAVNITSTISALNALADELDTGDPVGVKTVGTALQMQLNSLPVALSPIIRGAKDEIQQLLSELGF
jgi:hypothetical protein